MEDDPPLYAALAAMYGLTPRHLLREDRRVSTYEESFGTGRYGADDDPQGPPEPPLAPHDIEAPTGPERAGEGEWPFGAWSDVSSSVDPQQTLAPPLYDPVAPSPTFTSCPTCGSVVERDRIR